MAFEPVEWVLVVYYGSEAHRATYGRKVNSTRYTKDYIQLSRKTDFVQTLQKLFATEEENPPPVPLKFEWPGGNALGSLVFYSADRPHLKWETSAGAPRAWKMSPNPSDDTEETIPGEPSHLEFDAAENERALIIKRGAGQPYLMAVKLRNQTNTLHLRVYLSKPSPEFSWADISLAPDEIQDLATSTSQRSALAWAHIDSRGVTLDGTTADALSQLSHENNISNFTNTVDAETGKDLANFIEDPGHGVFFDPERNHDAWSTPPSLPESISDSLGSILGSLRTRFPKNEVSDSAAESYDFSVNEVEEYQERIDQKDYEILDSLSTIKTRGSAQKAFSTAVKSNYSYKCAITKIETKCFLVASHIVPWSMDQSIRLDPSNGICLSVLVDKAFEEGFILIDDDFTIRLNNERIGSDSELKSQLEPYDGVKLTPPVNHPPKTEYLERRRKMFTED